MASRFSLLAPLLLFNLIAIQVYATIILEEGYTVSTVIDGNKLRINPRSVLPRSSSSDLIILDSAGSTFYTFSFPNSQEGVIQKLSGNGIAKYSDGDLGSAMFNKPRSFAVDLKNNVYVADKNNHAIRKISKSGVTTIAGGYTQKAGKEDGPAQNASFSDDFELAFIPQRCALMISDHGNKLVRQINLKVEDCASGSESVLGSASAWVLGLGVACLLGLLVGLVIRPYVLPYEASSPYHLSETWKHCLISLGTRLPILCFDIRSATVSSDLYKFVKKLIALSVSQLTLMLGLNIVVKSQTSRAISVSLLDCDDSSGSSNLTKSQMVVNQLKDLVAFDGSVKPLDAVNGILERADENGERSDVVFPDTHGRIDSLIQANFIGFADQGKTTSVVESWESSSGLVREDEK